MGYRTLGVLLLACMVCACSGSADHTRDEAGAPAAEASAPASQAAPGMRVYLDPTTGLPTTPPSGVPVAAGPDHGKPPATLKEEAVPGGGFKVELDGRLQNYDATQKEKGEVR